MTPLIPGINIACNTLPCFFACSGLPPLHERMESDSWDLGNPRALDPLMWQCPSDLIRLLPVNLESQDVMNAVDGATIERRTRISRPGDESARCKVLRVLGQRKDFSQCMQQSTTHSTSNVISCRQERTEPFGPRRCR